MRRFSLLLALALASPAWGQSIKLPEKVSGQPGDFVTVASEADGAEVRWVSLDAGLKLFPTSLLKDTKTAVVISTVPGKYRLLAYTAKGDKPSDPAICLVVIEGVVPPAPPVPPTPPDPTPPKPPEPPPSPAPIPAPGFRVLMVYETAELSKLPPAQLAVMTAADVRAYLNAKCVKGPDGKTPEWRLWDKDVVTAAEAKLWQDAMARPRKSLPWLIVSDGTRGYEGPLPGTYAEMMKLLKSIGGE